jgi:outer membrane receptor protein involved in Fe transport
VSDIGGAGTRTRSWELTLDGASLLQKNAQISLSPPPEALQEFRVQTAVYDASIGRFTGAHINMVLKSGSNQLHGNLVFSHLSRPLMTRSFFINRSIFDTLTGPVTKQKVDSLWPPQRNNRYRGTVSGPASLPKLYNGRNRTFWMYSLDVLDRKRTQGSYATVPTAAQRSGDFSALLGLGSQYQIYDPATIAPAPNGRFSRQPFAGNRIPSNRLDSIARRLLENYPLPNVTGTADGRNNFATPGLAVVDYAAHIFRIDHSINDNHRFYVSGTYMNNPFDNGKLFDNNATGSLGNYSQRSASFDDVITARSDLIFNLRYNVNRFLNTPAPYSKGFDLGALGIAARLVNQLDPSMTTLPQLVIDGYTTLGGGGYSNTANTNHTIAGSATHLRGNHTLRLGAELRVLQENGVNYGNLSPRYDFVSTWTRGPLDSSPAAPIGQGLASFLLGIPTGGGIDRNASYAEQSNYLGLFLQDDWKLTRKLTLNLGVRYELELATTERFNRANRGFDFSTPNPIQEAARANYSRSPIPELPASQFRTTGGLLFAGVGATPRSLWDADRNNFAPRIGLAYQLRPTTVVRAGYGVFFESLGADRTDVPQQGFSQRTSLVPSLDSGLTFRATLANPFPDGLLEPASATAGLRTFLGRSVSFFLPTRKPGYTQRWSLGIQQQLPDRVLVEIGYVGTRGTGLGVSESLNALPAAYLSASPFRDQARIDFLSQAVANPFFGLADFAGSSLQGQTVQRAQLLSPYPHFTGVGTASSAGFSWYHSLQVRAEKRLSRGFTMNASYTWSKFMQAIEMLNESDLHPHHVISDQDRPHRIVVTAIYELPFGRGKKWLAGAPAVVNQLVGGWSVQGIFTGQSGPPIGFGNIAFYGDVHSLVLPRSQRRVERWFNTEAGFERDSRRQLASNIRTFPLRLTGLRADGFNNWDFSLLKNIKLRENVTFQLRAEATDALNHAMFAPPNTSPPSTLFGQVTAIQGVEQRKIAVGGRLTW